jgi:cold shock protein
MMGRGKDFRRPRRHGFDDDAFSLHDLPDVRSRRPFSGFASEPLPADGPPVAAVVKWFNAEKGFGFVELGDGSGDAFLHIAVLQAMGHQSVPPGATLRVHAGQGAKGRQVTQVLEVDESAAAPVPRRTPASAETRGRGAPDLSTAIEMTGTVKWFNGSKGFGFVAAEDGGKDVFVHISVLERAGLTGLAEGQRVSMRVVEAPKGREAVSIATAG